MTTLFDNSGIELPCQSCGRKTKKSIRWVKDHNEFTCTCGALNRFSADQFKARIGEIETRIAGLKSIIKKPKK